MRTLSRTEKSGESQATKACCGTVMVTEKNRNTYSFAVFWRFLAVVRWLLIIFLVSFERGLSLRDWSEVTSPLVLAHHLIDMENVERIVSDMAHY